MINCWARFVVCAMLLSSCSPSPTLGLAESHFEANVPDTKDFGPFLVRDLAAYLQPSHGDGLVLEYVLLRDGPTQSGLAFPKFYVWIIATKPDKLVIEGAARVSAVKKTHFDVTDFVTQAEIIGDSDALVRVFPQAVVEEILSKARAKT